MISLIQEPLFLMTLAAAVGLLLLVARDKISLPEQNDVVTAINDCLPQTQCAQCGHPGCLPYAEAIARGEAINRCPPGGEDTILALASLLGREIQPLDPDFGELEEKRVAVIREPECIGCTLCIQACPVDAIVGAQQLMHTVIEDRCTGCDLCLPPCPVDCIDMVAVAAVSIQVTPPNTHTHAKTAQEPSPCIRCGECETVCPKDLSPQNLLWQQASPEAMETLQLDACIECKLCDKACPSLIPLTAGFKATKTKLSELALAKEEAALAEQRFQQRELRLVEAAATVQKKPNQSDRKALLDRLRK